MRELLWATTRLAGESRRSGAPIDVVALLQNEAARWPAPPDADTLHALCRRLGVAKQVWTAYDAGWKRLPDAEPLGVEGFALLAAVCLAGAAADGEHGLRLKALNGALAAMERVPADSTVGNALEAVATTLMAELA